MLHFNHAKRCLIAFVLLVVIGLFQYATAQTFPTLVGRVVDQADILEPEHEQKLIAQLEQLEAQTTHQIVVVTVKNLEGYAIADYANRLGRTWEIGSAENNNGVLLLVAPNERKVRIEVGYGLEGALTDSLSSIIIQNDILPSFRKNQYPQGIDNGVAAISQAVSGEYVVVNDASDGKKSAAKQLEKYIPAIFIGLVGLIEILRRSGMRKAANGAFPAGFMGLFTTIGTGNLAAGLLVAVMAFLFFYFNDSGGRGGGGRSTRGGRGYSSSRGGFGGGGFSGGGGSFGGGGASGSW